MSVSTYRTGRRRRASLLLVGLVLALWVADLAADIVLLADHVVTDTLGVRILQVGVEVDLDDTVRDGVEVVLFAGSGATVEDEEDGLLVLGALLVLHVLLVLAEQLGPELDVAGLIHTVHVAEAGGDGEVRRDGAEGLVDLVDVLGLGVEAVVVDTLIVDAILLASRNADLHL